MIPLIRQFQNYTLAVIAILIYVPFLAQEVYNSQSYLY